MRNTPFESRRFSELPKGSLRPLYRNPALEPEIARLGIDLKRSAVFLDPNGGLELDVLDFHHRNVGLPGHDKGPVVEEQGGHRHAYCRFSAKGVGFVKPETHESKKEGIAKGSMADSEEVVFCSSPDKPWGYDALGLCDKRLVSIAVERTRRCAALGMRVESYAAVFGVDTVFVRGEPIAVETLKEEAKHQFAKEARNTLHEISKAKALVETGRSRKDAKDKLKELEAKRKNLAAWGADLAKNYEPVIAIRLTRSLFRVRDAADASPQQLRFMVEEAMANLQAEARALGRPVPEYSMTQEGLELYARDLGRWCGENLGALFASGQSHMFLHSGNITLAGEVVDLDSVEYVLQPRPEGPVLGEGARNHRRTHGAYGIPACLVKDMRDMALSLKTLLRTLISPLEPTTPQTNREVTRELVEGFRRRLGNAPSPYSAISITNEKLCDVFSTIAHDMIVHRHSFPPVPPDGEAL